MFIYVLITFYGFVWIVSAWVCVPLNPSHQVCSVVNWFIYVYKSECNFSQMFIFQIVQLDLSVFFKCILYLFQYNHGSIRGRICVNLYTFTYLWYFLCHIYVRLFYQHHCTVVPCPRLLFVHVRGPRICTEYKWRFFSFMVNLEP